MEEEAEKVRGRQSKGGAGRNREWATGLIVLPRFVRCTHFHFTLLKLKYRNMIYFKRISCSYIPDGKVNKLSMTIQSHEVL